MHIFCKVALTIIAKRKNQFWLARLRLHHWQFWAHKAKRLFVCLAIADKTTLVAFWFAGRGFGAFDLFNKNSRVGKPFENGWQS